MSLPAMCIFDLDGVIVDTAKYHYRAWKTTAARLGYILTPSKNECLKGVSRRDSLAYLLEWAGVTLQPEDFDAYCEEKNTLYLQYIQKVSPEDALDGVVSFIRQLKEKDLQITLGSASKNARIVLKKLNILSLFDFIVDGTMTTNGKPHPEVFLHSSRYLGIPPSSTVVFEDAGKGVLAAQRAGMSCIGIGNKRELTIADVVWPGFAGKTSKDLSAFWTNRRAVKTHNE